jgi:hypothetical protein
MALAEFGGGPSRKMRFPDQQAHPRPRLLFPSGNAIQIESDITLVMRSIRISQRFAQLYWRAGVPGFSQLEGQ